MASSYKNGDVLGTRILPVNTSDLGQFNDRNFLEIWELPSDSSNLSPLQEAASHLQKSNIPVAFPTETVYGLGADATRSSAVKGIYKAKGRPSDNPLIIHVCDLSMLRSLLLPSSPTNGQFGVQQDPIPEIYKPLIKRFWPGPLTILLPNPENSKLAPEVTAGLKSFGARMPSSPLALSLIRLAGVPLAAPSANASTKPSCTTAQHVLHDLDGRIEVILDGGACQVGVESTVVDGMCDPPVVLRPGGVSLDSIRECEGWEEVVKGYKDQNEIGDSAPRAPGMKYKHYSPKAKVVLYEASANGEGDICKERISEEIERLATNGTLDHPAKVGIVCTKKWGIWAGIYTMSEPDNSSLTLHGIKTTSSLIIRERTFQSSAELQNTADIIEISLGTDTKEIAHGLFSALRELDIRGVDVIYVEGIPDEGDIAEAVMNRLRKAATIIEK
ncbi:hypothetical protein B7494_g3979 [Chlorociboria aeruginascens]|nr:hypothetical protein B7494_g3979 [Chlorociboria aeruginascens]